MSGKGFLQIGWETCLDWLYPRDCLHCHTPVEKDAKLKYLCETCWQQVEVFRPPQCPQCGLPYYGIVTTERECQHCKELNPYFRRGQTTFRLRSPMRSLIHALKYAKGRYALQDLINVALSASETRSFLENSILVPVPLHPIRYLKRTYNQSELIARALSERVKYTHVDTCLRRVKWTDTQTRLTFAERQKNLKDVFAIQPNYSIQPEKKYVVVDDVFTTGSTLNSCCKALLEAGITKLDIFALGHG